MLIAKLGVVIQIPILSLARELPRTPIRGLDGVKKQVF